MAKTAAEFEQEFIQTAKEKTGKSLDEWLDVIKPGGYIRTMQILNWLKVDHKLNHMQANFLANIYLNKGQVVYQDENNLLENQFAKCEAMRPLFDSVSKNILTQFPGTQLIPKKTYLSFAAQREFAAINVKPKEIRLGLDLGEEPFNEIVQKSKLSGPMPRISHMVALTDVSEFDDRIFDYLRQSYNRSNKK
jgi:predicted transport protein